MATSKLMKKYGLLDIDFHTLEALSEELASHGEKLKEAHVESTKEKVLKMLADSGLSADILKDEISVGVSKGNAAKKEGIRKTTPAKYRNPKNAEETWSRGRTPHWVKSEIEERGISVEEFKNMTEFLNPKNPNYDEYVKELSD